MQAGFTFEFSCGFIYFMLSILVSEWTFDTKTWLSIFLFVLFCLFMEGLGMEPRTLGVLSTRSATEPYLPPESRSHADECVYVRIWDP